MHTQTNASETRTALDWIQRAGDQVDTGTDAAGSGRASICALVPAAIMVIVFFAFSSSCLVQAQATTDVQAQMQAGASAMAAGDFAAAVKDYTAVTARMPSFAAGYFNLGLALEQAGKLEEARTALEHSLQLKPGLRGAHLFLGITDYRLNHLKQAEVNLTKETQIDPHDAKAFMWLGVCRLAEGDAQAAIKPLDTAYALDPRDADILYHRGRAYLLVANASYDAMFKLNHDSMRVHQVLGEAYAQAYRNQEAVSEFELAVRMAPQHPGLHEELADQYWASGTLDKVAAAYREELTIDPYSVSTKYKLGAFLVLNQGSAEGVKLLREALAADPTLIDAHYYLGTGLTETGEPLEAIHEFEQAIAANPNDDRAMMSYYKLALEYRTLHEPEQAKAAMDNFLRMRAQIKSRQAQHTAQIARNRTELPVNDPEKIVAGTQPQP